MAYDERLGHRIRDEVLNRKGVTEKKMFGGLGFMLDGKMFCGVIGDQLVVRVGPDLHESSLLKPLVRTFDFTGRPMKGYVYVAPLACASESDLRTWIETAAAHVSALPAKTPGSATAPKRKGP